MGETTLLFLKGEVRINQDQLNSFLYSAKSLGIRGLMDAENSTNNTHIKEDRRKKRRRSMSSASSSGTGTEPLILNPPAEGTGTTLQPPLPSTTPQLISHKTNMIHHHHHHASTVKTEPFLIPNPNNHQYQSDIAHYHPPDFLDTLTQSNSESISAQEIEDDDLEMLQYVRPGTSNGNSDGLSNMHQGKSY